MFSRRLSSSTLALDKSDRAFSAAACASQAFLEVDSYLLKLAAEGSRLLSVVRLELSDLRSDGIAVCTKLIPLLGGKV